MDHAVEVTCLRKVYPNGTRANDGLDLRICEGETVAVIGPNGAGKTTLIRQLLGLIRPTSGNITVLGRDISANPRLVKGLVGYVPQIPLSFPALTVDETIGYVLRMSRCRPQEVRHRVTQTLELVGLAGMARMLGYQLSPGMVKLVLLGMALCQAHPLLVLDEPTAMVDIINRARIWKALASAGGRTILLASHDLGEVRELCDRAYVVVGGRVIAEGSPQALSASLPMGAEARFIPVHGDGAARLLAERGLEFRRTGDEVFSVEFDQLDRCIEFAKELSDRCGLRYLQVEGPSFARAIVQMMEGGGHGGHR